MKILSVFFFLTVLQFSWFWWHRFKSGYTLLTKMSTPCLSSSLLPSSVIIFYPSSYTWQRKFSIESACVSRLLVFRHIGEHISSDLFTQLNDHAQSFIRFALSELYCYFRHWSCHAGQLTGFKGGVGDGHGPLTLAPPVDDTHHKYVLRVGTKPINVGHQVCRVHKPVTHSTVVRNNTVSVVRNNTLSVVRNNTLSAVRNNTASKQMLLNNDFCYSDAKYRNIMLRLNAHVKFVFQVKALQTHFHRLLFLAKMF